MIPEKRKPEDYADIIDYEYHGTTTHVPMPMEKRAAQFSPFAALTGLGARFNEEMRYTDDKTELTEDKIEEINRGILQLSDAISGKETAEAIMSWFIPDPTKTGGMYRTDHVTIQKIDDRNHIIILKDGTEIPVENVTGITPTGRAE